ncbi:NAD(P)-binding protein [Daldinia caldariorum]|uniref:NAD(P)-binding protein n=1 Tax=Daldinia caldariorum TaxID=326644 RepID=UPI0020076354|nr:NAD(P)-binding protein [Daldinia caldariorum]KAI1470046.1 NAD(P)-binding protein [Daldinia caldariorum]
MSRKPVVITGCSEGGIGAALTLEFHVQGYRVFATARNVDKMRPLAGKGIETPPLNVDSDESIAVCAASVAEATETGTGTGTDESKLDCLINNAGVHHVLPFTDSRIDDLRRVVNTNVVGTLAVTHAFVPLLNIWRGGSSTWAWFLPWFGWEGIFDSSLAT